MVEQLIHEDDGTWRIKVLESGHWTVLFKPIVGKETIIFSGHIEENKCIFEFEQCDHPALPLCKIEYFSIIARFLCEKGK